MFVLALCEICLLVRRNCHVLTIAILDVLYSVLCQVALSESLKMDETTSSIKYDED